MSNLDSALLAAHEAGDKSALVRLYTEAADQAAQVDAACFFLTQAYVFALEVGDPSVAILHGRLAAEGRV